MVLSKKKTYKLILYVLVAILIKDNSDMDILKLDSDIDKLEMFFLVILGVKDLNEKINISLEKEKAFLLIQVIT